MCTKAFGSTYSVFKSCFAITVTLSLILSMVSPTPVSAANPYEPLQVIYKAGAEDAVSIRLDNIVKNPDGTITAEIHIESKKAITYDLTMSSQGTVSMQPLNLLGVNFFPLMAKRTWPAEGQEFITFSPGSSATIYLDKFGKDSSDALTVVFFDILTMVELFTVGEYLPTVPREMIPGLIDGVVGLFNNAGFDALLFEKDMYEGDYWGALQQLGDTIKDAPSAFAAYIQKTWGIIISTESLTKIGAIFRAAPVVPVIWDLFGAPRHAELVISYPVSYSGKNEVSTTDIANPDSYSCSQPGYIDFEGLPDGTDLTSGTIAGMQFRTTDGFTWRVGDFATGYYNGKYPNGAYTSHGTHWAWLGVSQGSGRIDFPMGPASYFSLLVSDSSPVSVDAYDSNNNLLASTTPSPSNIYTGHMTELKITRAVADMAYVMVHDQGNYFEVDDVCTNAPGTPNTIRRILDQSYFMETGQQVSGNFMVDTIISSQNQLHIFVGPFGSDVDLNLIRPDGTLVSPNSPGVTYNKTNTSVDVIIDNVDEGEWQYEIVANQLDDGGESIPIKIDVQTFITSNAPPDLVVPSNQSLQYSDSTSFIVSATDSDNPSNELIFSAVGLPPNLVIIDHGDGTAMVKGISQVSPGTYDVEIIVYDPEGMTDSKLVSIVVNKEDARTTYAGPLMVSTGCATCSTAVVPLRATIQDITAVLGDPSYDLDAGDIINATVSFVDRNNGDAILCSSNVILLDQSDQTVGTAFCDWTADLGNSPGSDFVVGVIVDGYYTRNSSDEDTVVVVSKPTSNFITGGGYFINQNSGGTYFGDPELKTNFGLTIKFNKKLTNLQGHVTIIVRQDGRVYQIKSNALSSLVSVPYDPAKPRTGSAELIGKANVTDVTDPLNPIVLAGNATLNIVMKDNGEPGSADLISISLWSKDGELLFSSNWNGTQTVEQFLGGGNLSIK